MITTGQVYRHFKGNRYRVVCSALHSETQEELVIYASIDDPARVWARPLSLFTDQVAREDYSGPRFVLEDDHDVDCEHFIRGIPGGDCYSLGHYECRECQRLDPLSPLAREPDDETA